MASGRKPRSSQIRQHGENQFRLERTLSGTSQASFPSQAAHTAHVRENEQPLTSNVRIFNANSGMAQVQSQQRPPAFFNSFRNNSNQLSPPRTPQQLIPHFSQPQTPDFTAPPQLTRPDFPAPKFDTLEADDAVPSSFSYPHDHFTAPPTPVSPAHSFPSFTPTLHTLHHTHRVPEPRGPRTLLSPISTLSRANSTPSIPVINRVRHGKSSKEDKVHEVLNTLGEVALTSLEYVTLFLRLRSTRLVDYQTAAFNDRSPHIDDMLDAIWDDPRGQERLKKWMEPHAVDLVAAKVSVEMEQAKAPQLLLSKAVDPKYIATWDVNSFIKPSTTPIWTRILTAATDNATAVLKNVLRTAHTVRSTRYFFIFLY